MPRRAWRIALVLLGLTWAGCAGDPEQSRDDFTTPGDGGTTADDPLREDDQGADDPPSPDGAPPTNGASDAPRVNVEIVGEPIGVVRNTPLGDEYVVFGRVRNGGAEAVSYPEVTVTFRDAEGNVLGTARSLLALLNPGDEWPFKATTPYDMSASPQDVTNFSVTVTADRAFVFEPLPRETLEILSDNLQEREFGGWKVLGEVRNGGSAAAEQVEVAAVLTDGAGGVVDVVTGYASPSELGAGEAGAFELTSSYNEPRVADYEVFVSGAKA